MIDTKQHQRAYLVCEVSFFAKTSSTRAPFNTFSDAEDYIENARLDDKHGLVIDEYDGTGKFLHRHDDKYKAAEVLFLEAERKKQLSKLDNVVWFDAQKNRAIERMYSLDVVSKDFIAAYESSPESPDDLMDKAQTSYEMIVSLIYAQRKGSVLPYLERYSDYVHANPKLFPFVHMVSPELHGLIVKKQKQQSTNGV